MSNCSVQIDDLLKFKLVSDPQISSDGKSVLFGVEEVKEKNNALYHLYVVSLDGKVEQRTQGEKRTGAGRWAPGSSAISFVSARNTPGSQIFVLSESGEAQQITTLTECSIGAYKWSVNGKHNAFTFPETPRGFSELETK